MRTSLTCSSGTVLRPIATVTFTGTIPRDYTTSAMQTRDYLERMIRQIAEVLARIGGFTAEGKYDEAERELDGVWSTALGIRRKDVTRLDDGTLRMMLGPAKLEHAATLLDAEADLATARGDAAKEARLRALAKALRPT